MSRPALATILVLIAAPVASQAAERPYMQRLDEHIDCASRYVAVGLAKRWEVTAGDLADAALASCEKQFKAYEHAIATDKDLQLDFDQVRRLSAEHAAALRLTLVRHIVEKRNPSTQPQ